MKFDNDRSLKGPHIELDGLRDEVNAEFPWLNAGFEDIERASDLAETAIRIAQIVGEATQVERIPKGPDGKRENIVTHSYMLTILALHTIKKYNLPLDIVKVIEGTIVHDWPELITGDVNTFRLTPQGRDERDKQELIGRETISNLLPGWLADSLQEYVRQDTAEATLVRGLDKVLPLAVNIAHEDLSVVKQDFDIGSEEELINSHRLLHRGYTEKNRGEWPESVLGAHALECMMLEDIYRNKPPEDLEAPKDPNETKRRFLVNKKDLDRVLETTLNYRTEEIRQFYPEGGADGSSTRIRSYDDKTFTIMTRSPGTLQRKKSDEVPLVGLTVEGFDKWHESTSVAMIEKTKIFIPHGDIHTIEVGRYHGAQERLVIAAIKFNGRDAMAKSQLVDKPWWFGEEVTGDTSFFGHRLAEKGIVESPEED